MTNVVTSSATDDSKAGKLKQRLQALPRRHRIGLICLISLLGLIVGVFLLVGTRSQPQTIVVDPNIPNDYALMTPAQIAVKLRASTGLSIHDLETKPLSASSFKSFQQAYIAGQALNGLHKYRLAAQAYAVALSRVPVSESYVFYERYALVAGMTGDVTLQNSLDERAQQVIPLDNQLSNTDKQRLLQQIADRQHLRKLGY